MSPPRQLTNHPNSENHLRAIPQRVGSVSPGPTQPSLLDYLPPKPNVLGLLLAEEDVLVDSPSSPEQWVVLEDGVRLSQCQLWEILLNYYASQGINAWQNNVPSFITSSVYCAETYAETIVAFLRDYYSRLDLSQPVYIVELATGTGRFSFHLLRELERKLACFSALGQIDLRYVMTDFTESNIQFWQSHRRLQPFVESGNLDFAVFNPLVEQSMRLVVSGQSLNCEAMQNPVIAIANYFFDSTPVDVFQVENHCLKEGLVTLERKLAGVEPDSEPHISEINVEFEYQPLENCHYYPDAALNAVLTHYCREFQNGNLLFPLGAFDVVRNLRQLSNDRLVLLSSDKGFTDARKMMGYEKHEFAIHDGTFSYMVNYDAFRLYFNQLGGSCFGTTLAGLGVQTVCFVSMSDDDLNYESIRHLFFEKINRHNPTNSLLDILDIVTDKHIERTLENKQLFTIIRTQLADSYAVALLCPHVKRMISQTLSNEEQAELIRLLDLALDNYYFYPGGSDLPLYLAPIFYQMEDYNRSLFCWRIMALYKYSEVTCYLGAGLCFEKLEQFSDALAHYEMALQLEPDSPLAKKVLYNITCLKERMGSNSQSEQDASDETDQQGQ